MRVAARFDQQGVQAPVTVAALIVRVGLVSPTRRQAATQRMTGTACKLHQARTCPAIHRHIAPNQTSGFRVLAMGTEGMMDDNIARRASATTCRTVAAIRVDSVRHRLVSTLTGVSRRYDS